MAPRARARRRVERAERVEIVAKLTIFAAAVALAAAVAGCKGKRGGNASAAADAAPADAGQQADASREGGAHAASAPPVPDLPDDLMPVSNEGMAARARHLLEAIAGDDAALANDILFPRDGWAATRDAADPTKDWEKHVAAPFRHSVHALSRHHVDFARAQFVSLELGTSIAQAATRPHSWKKALWTVHGSRLTFVLDGRTRTLPVHELTAWRGEWYVTRLR
jgi:hypothetical protein